MKLLKVLSLIILTPFFLTACQTTKNSVCQSADNINIVSGAGECLAIHTAGTPSDNNTLLIFIHGDGTGGRASSYFYDDAERFGSKGIISVALIRPGYFAADGQKSTGISYRYQGNGYRLHIITEVADAIQNLKTKHQAKKVILVGFSGGSGIAGVILGKYPDLADAALLSACPCNVPKWRVARRGKNNWTSSLSPHNYIRNIKAKKVIVLMGGRDSNTKVILGEDYLRRAKEEGINVELIVVPSASHGGIIHTSEFSDSIKQLLKL